MYTRGDDECDQILSAFKRQPIVTWVTWQRKQYVYDDDCMGPALFMYDIDCTTWQMLYTCQYTILYTATANAYNRAVNQGSL